MLRDSRRDEEYFKNYIEKKNKKIEKIEMKMLELINDLGADCENVNKMQNSITLEYLHRLIAMYSLGSSIDEMRESFIRYMEIEDRVKERHTLSYNNIILIFSLAILLDIDEKIMENFKNRLNESRYSKYRDTVFEFLTGIPKEDKAKEWKPHTLTEILSSSNEDEQIELLRTYATHWYSRSSGAYWYGYHKKNEELYFGYWCFESAAIAKKLKLDEKHFEDIQYYPKMS